MTQTSPPNSSPDGDAEPTAPSGFSDVVAEIVAETERRRQSGEYPPELLERLDAEFDRFAPLSFRRTGMDGAVRAVEAAAFVNVDAPITGSGRLARALKTAVKKSTGWYHLYVARQVTALGIQITRPLRMLDERTELLSRRISDIENTIQSRSPHLAAMIETLADSTLSKAATDEVVNMFIGFAGRIVHLGASDPDVVTALVNAGIDAYGVTPGGGGNSDVEIRAESVFHHLYELAVASLSGVVVTGVSDTASTSERVELCRLVVDRVEPGGRIVIVTMEPQKWSSKVGPVVSDLAGSRPLHTETWLHLLTGAGARAARLDATIDAQRIFVASAS